MLDGVDVAQLDPGWLRRQIGVVLQENILFNRSIHENIALGDPAMARARVMQAARLAGADEFIAQLPQGYDTIIEERGANLSGGQRQRIAIARALATNPRILIFDEATSALDYESERIIQEQHGAIARGRTVLIIAHRLAAVRPCTRIVGMNRGEIVEVGSHAELLARPNGLYRRLWELQSAQWRRPKHEPAHPASRRYPELARARPAAHSGQRHRGATASSCPPRSRSSRRRRRRCPSSLMLTICLFFAAALAWSFFGRLDVHAVAQGKIERAGRAKVIQPLEPGKIAAIHVALGDHVKAGDLVMELDPAEAMADAMAQSDARDASLAEVARRRAAIEIARSVQREPEASRRRLEIDRQVADRQGRRRFGEPDRLGRQRAAIGALARERRAFGRSLPARRRARRASTSRWRRRRRPASASR